MGKEVVINSLEEMCDLMCDNKLPKEKPQWFMFTFGVGQKHGGHYVRIFGTWESSREEMIRRYGTEWCWQYTEKKWKEMLSDKNRKWTPETELKEDDE